jgi:hypothetical protein
MAFNHSLELSIEDTSQDGIIVSEGRVSDDDDVGLIVSEDDCA